MLESICVSVLDINIFKVLVEAMNMCKWGAASE